jgi:ribosomal peptide maturation radical SAM protein 1
MEALRCLKRRLSDVVYRQLVAEIQRGRLNPNRQLEPTRDQEYRTCVRLFSVHRRMRCALSAMDRDQGEWELSRHRGVGGGHMGIVQPVRIGSRPDPGLAPPRVALVTMPFTTSRSPSVQIGLLQATLGRAGIPATSWYFNLELAHLLGWERYEILCNDRTLLLGEWLFARAAFGAEAPPGRDYLDRFAAELAEPLAALDATDDYLLELRDRVLPAFVDECASWLDPAGWDVVGFSSIFEQNCAALALARRVKERNPALVTVFGGANFEDEMGLEYVRALPWVDFAVIGEGDEVFPAFLWELAAGRDPGGLAGVASRGPDGGTRFAGRAAPVTDMDRCPEPDYDPFFRRAAELAMPEDVAGRAISLPFETARGCWWGAKHHCTFCGLNGMGMAFRAKSPARALAGIDELAARYARYQLVAVDNIMDLTYVDGVFGVLESSRRDYTFFYETKANLSHEQLGTLVRGGVRHLQPGIESLSTPVLKLMRKGTTALQNVRLLKWGRYFEVSMHWNVLVGFPGERAEDYRRQLAVMRLVPHLQPPESVGRIWLERFSPFYTQRDELGITDVRPEPAYAHVYPDRLDHDRIAYFFQYEARDALPLDAHRELSAYVAEWNAAWTGGAAPFLVSQRGAGRLTVTDGRHGPPTVTAFGEVAALVYEACTPTLRGTARIAEHVRAAGHDDTDVKAALDEFVDLGLMLEEDGHYLALAVPVNPNW